MKEKKTDNKWVLCIDCYKLSLKGHEECPYCGAKLENEEEETAPSYPEIRYDKIGEFGFILACISFISYFISPSLSLTVSLISIVLIVLGTNSKADKYGLVIGVLTALSSMIFIVGIILFSSNDSISFTRLEHKETMGSILEIDNNNNKVSAYDTWFEESGLNLLILEDDGNFSWYSNRNNLNINYFTGVFQLFNGVDLYGEKVYDDGEYYYYQLLLTKFKVNNISNIRGVNKDKQEEYYFTLRKDGKRSCLENVSSRIKTCFSKTEESIL